METEATHTKDFSRGLQYWERFMMTASSVSLVQSVLGPSLITYDYTFDDKHTHAERGAHTR